MVLNKDSYDYLENLGVEDVKEVLDYLENDPLLKIFFDQDSKEVIGKPFREYINVKL